jgi:peptidyl-prolyl cis-trans isomerase A (cyclophilin A)/peptidyl-prolyl cis-trans isomerase B (cyclophilin B)
MEVLNKIAATPTGAGGPFPSDVPREAVIIEEARLMTGEAAEPAASPSK